MLNLGDVIIYEVPKTGFGVGTDYVGVVHRPTGTIACSDNMRSPHVMRGQALDRLRDLLNTSRIESNEPTKMTKTIEEVKAAKRSLELKISQMVNEFAKEYDIRVDLRLTNINGIGQPTYYVCETEIKL